MPPVTVEELLMFVEKSVVQSVDQGDDFYLPTSLFRQGPKTR